VCLERGPLSLVSTNEELLEKKSSGSGLEIREYAVGIRHADHVASLSVKLALTSPTNGGSSVAYSGHGEEYKEQTSDYQLAYC
jgi:hypothetical protein